MPDQPAPFALSLLGPFRLTTPGGDRIAISSRKGVALIALLAMAPEGERTRAWLQDKLWGSRDQEHGRASLRSEISNLRASLGAHSSTLLASERDRVRLDLGQLNVDAHAWFLGEAPPSDWPIPGDFLEGLDLPGEDAFEDWLRDQRSALRELAGRAELPRPAVRPVGVRPPRRSICVLPFANMSGEPEQEYFSDGISEDIITDLSKVSALQVTARNTAFTFKGKAVEVAEVARKLSVTHVVEGSVRKAGGRVRISAQLIDGATGDHLWAERYDRDLTDIFALQDEVTEAIVGALKLKLLPEEKKAIERRGTDNADAYDLYLMARQTYVVGNQGDARGFEAIIRLCGKAVEIDPAYARAWALMAEAQVILRFRFGRQDIDSSAAVEKAVALNPNLAEAHATKTEDLRVQGRLDEAWKEAGAALRLDPECYEANWAAANVCFNQGRIADAIPYYEKAAALMGADIGALTLLITCYTAQGDTEGAIRTARTALARAEAALAKDGSSGSAMGHGAEALAVLGEADRARDWIRRALLIDPDNQNMRYNFACAHSVHLKDIDGALDLLGPYLTQVTRPLLDWLKVDPDIDPLRDDPRFQAMLAAAEARLAGVEPAAKALT